MVCIFNHRVELVRQHTPQLFMARTRYTVKIVNQPFNLCLQLIRKLVAGTRENFNAVVFIRIVACGNDYARIRPVADGQICYRRCWDHAQQLYIGPYRTNACNQRIFQHIRRNAGILADQQLCLAAAPVLPLERICRSRANPKRQHSIKLDIRYAANAVGSKILTQSVILLSGFSDSFQKCI